VNAACSACAYLLLVHFFKAGGRFMRTSLRNILRRHGLRADGGRLAAVLVALLLSLSVLSGGAMAQPTSDIRASTPNEPVQTEVRAVLSQYGRFVQHARYGEVWVPTVTPQGWHPYPPCHWVKTQQYGWYYDDKTPWGQIVHHYGRWFWDQQIGWAWDPGSEFSPGWVVWRTSPEWVGWAPMPPDQAFQNASSDQFNNSDQWIFIETAKFNNGCDAMQIAPVERVPVLLRQTKWVTAVEYVDGIVVIVLPPYVIGPIVIVNIGFDPWAPWYMVQVMIDFNFAWQKALNFNVAHVCTPSNPN
jgi:hypothetical protein